MSRALLAAAAAGLLALAACGHPASPAQQVHAEVARLGYPVHDSYQYRAAVVSAKTDCELLHHGATFRSLVRADTPAFYGSAAKAAAFLSTAISAYCPRLRAAE
jgi:hypothetical protein